MGKMVPVSEFKAKCLALLDEMERSGKPLTITRRGKPALTLTAKRIGAQPRPLFGAMKGTFTVHGDIVGPIDPDWEAAWEDKWDKRGMTAGSGKPAR